MGPGRAQKSPPEPGWGRAPGQEPAPGAENKQVDLTEPNTRFSPELDSQRPIQPRKLYPSPWTSASACSPVGWRRAWLFWTQRLRYWQKTKHRHRIWEGEP